MAYVAGTAAGGVVAATLGRDVELRELAGRRVAVWGTGREGIAAVEAIAPAGPQRLITVQDTANFLATNWAGALADAAPLFTGEDAHRELAGIDVIVRSPGIPDVHPWIVGHRARGGVVTSGTALWMSAHRQRTVGVTGSKGKSTTSSLVHALLAGAGRPNELGGNIGIAALAMPPAELYVMELSAYQCADLDDSPRVAVVTSLFPEHLDWFGGEEAYFRGKLNIAMHGAEAVVYNGHDPRLAAEFARRAGLPLVAAGLPDGFHVAPGPDGTRWFFRADRALFPRADLGLLGRHNEGNLCVALAAIEAIGVDCVASRDALATALRGFAGLEHRLQPIADPSGLTFVDDSLSTIPQSTIHAIENFADRPLSVIVGGDDRGVDYSPLRDYLRENKINATLIGIPDSGPMILSLVADLPGITAVPAADMHEAVRIGRERTAAGGVVLMSPAAASYGRYDNYAHRSRVFREAIEATRP
ncbi:UDP-N-acetylmuramoyl-L-alanine--D-glutamate ligase [Catenuloplanes indicus JCM 9534]|uniref:UDP-N-acetylmuramoylalanine--D-glutamate ligase n=1 Tax=Catenuloplanes indicus TaxID=137267 RepID=A0AAE3W900_9ACTN|nr:UDP-N-acetylmuramoylalanine--D-glutamate ligase [Catenuloplanes indicus]